MLQFSQASRGINFFETLFKTALIATSQANYTEKLDFHFFIQVNQPT